MSRVTLPTLPANGNYVDAVQLDNIFNALLAGVNSVDNTQLATGAALANIGTNGVTSQYLALANQLNQMGWYSVKDYGATGQGVGDDSSGVQAAITAATTGSVGSTTAGIYFPPGSYELLTSFTFTVPVVFAPGASLTSNAAGTQTFQAPIIAPPTYIFNTVNTISIDGHTPLVYAEWFGAVGNGTTNDTLAINKAITSLVAVDAGVNSQPGNRGGTVQLLAKVYAITALTINRGNVTLQGMGIGKTVLRQTGAGNVALSIGSGTQYWYVNCREFSIDNAASLAIATGSVGIAVNGAQQSNFENVSVLQQATGVSITNTGNCYFRNVATYVTYAPTATTIKGFDINGATANASLTLDTCAADFPSLVSSGVPIGGFTSYGFYVHGTTIKDVFFRGCQASNIGYGVYIDGTGGTSAYDLHFLDTIIDTFFVSAFYFNQLGVTSTVEINGGWTNPATIGAVAYNVYAASSHGITLTNVTLFGGPNNANQQGVRLASCADIVVSSCIFKNFQYGIYSNGSGLCTFVGNSFYNVTGQNGVNAIYADATSYRLGINSNNVNGQAAASWSTGILVAAGCDYCNVVANTLNAGGMTATVNVNAGTNTHTYLAGVIV
jgi:hypothetical protein